MKKNAFFGAPLFKNCSMEEVAALLKELSHYIKEFQKDDVIYKSGDSISHIGLILKGAVQIEYVNLFGDCSILGFAEVGDIFAESYACIPNQPLLVDVVAKENCQILFLSLPALMALSSQNDLASKVVQNLLMITAKKNLGLSMRIFHASPKKIRDRLYSYFSEQVALQGSTDIKIPMDRQQLADYLGVDRTALSKELGKMKKDGLLDYRKNHFILHLDI